MATINILVSRIGQSTNLSLKQGTIDLPDDSLVTDVDANDTVIWSLNPTPDPGCNTEITLLHVKAADSSIGKYSNSQQLLVNDEYNAVNDVITATVKADPPAPKPGQGAGAKSFENYKIGFYKNSDPNHTEQWDDPKLKMR